MKALHPLGKYQLFKRLAVGGMAEIHLARQLGLQGFEKLVVVKTMLPNLAQDPEVVAMFLDEARLAASLNHPNVTQVFDLGEADGKYFIAMEYVAGHDLHALVRQGVNSGKLLPAALAARIVAWACEGLHFAHSRKDLQGHSLHIVHRDMSPGNVLLSYDGAVKVTDFGVAKAETQSTRTSVGRVKGKFAYMSPEQVRGEPVDARSDVFSLGVVLFEALTGRRLFKRDNEAAIVHAIAEEAVPAPSSFRPEVPQALDAICLKALSKKLDERYQSARELAVDLEQLLNRLNRPPTAVDLGQYLVTTFGEDFAAYERALRELPAARPEDLAALFGPASGPLTPPGPELRPALGVTTPGAATPRGLERRPDGPTTPGEAGPLGLELDLSSRGTTAPGAGGPGAVELDHSSRGATAPGTPGPGGLELDLSVGGVITPGDTSPSGLELDRRAFGTVSPGPEEPSVPLGGGPALRADGAVVGVGAPKPAAASEPKLAPAVPSFQAGPLELAERGPRAPTGPLLPEPYRPVQADRGAARGKVLLVASLVVAGVLLGGAVVAWKHPELRLAPASAPMGVKPLDDLDSLLGPPTGSTLTVESVPSGATVRLGERVLGTTPWVGDGPGRGVQLVLSKPGYKTAIVKLAGSTDEKVHVKLSR